MSSFTLPSHGSEVDKHGQRDRQRMKHSVLCSPPGDDEVKLSRHSTATTTVSFITDKCENLI